MGTHYVARELIAIGHDVSQVPPAYAEDLLVIGERPTTETASFLAGVRTMLEKAVRRQVWT